MAPMLTGMPLKNTEHRKEGEMSSVIELGSCGLHIVHGALQTGMTQIWLELSQSS